jgi:hypothetical protein
MAAWTHSTQWGWNSKTYYMYRKYVIAHARSYEKSDKDCADLSITMLVEFAAKYQLTVTFQDAKNGLYVSKAAGLIRGSSAHHELDDDITWGSKEEFLATVRKRTSARDLLFNNSRESEFGPLPGDLMLKSDDEDSHAAIVFGTYAPGQAAYPEYQDVKGYPDFPGPDAAKRDFNQTRYFRGDVDDDGVTLSRVPEGPFKGDVHFNYLNSRSNKKRNAELIYFANARQLRKDGFGFYEYSLAVTDNWLDWDGDGLPPFRNHRWPGHR